MTEVERLQGAVKRLEELRDRTVQTGGVDAEMMRTALAMVVPVLRILRQDVRLIADLGDVPLPANIQRALERSGDLALASAILGEQDT